MSRPKTDSRPVMAGLSEQLGPRARRQVRVATALALAAIAALLVVAARRLSDRGQFDADLWLPFTDPGTIRFLFGGLMNTLRAAAAAGAVALVVGLILALGRLSPRGPVRWASGAYIEFFRAVPLVLLILFCAFGLPVYGIDPGPFGFLVLGLTIYNAAVLAEIYRSGVLALDRGQAEAAASIGLGYWSALFLVVLPQAARRMAPAIVSQLVILLKDTSLGAVIPFDELLGRSQSASIYSHNRLQGLFVAAVVYIIVNYGLSRIVVRLQRRREEEPDGLSGASAPEGWLRWRRPPTDLRSSL